MARHIQTEEAVLQLSATSRELFEAAEMVRRETEEKTQRERETVALAAALQELGVEATPDDLLDAVARLRFRKAHARRRLRNRRFALVALSVAIIAIGPLTFRRATRAPQTRVAAASVPSPSIRPVSLESVLGLEARSDAELLRRAYLDTRGTVPAPAEVRAFVDDQTPEKGQKLMVKLLLDRFGGGLR